MLPRFSLDDLVRAKLDQGTGPAFETICQEAVWRAHSNPGRAPREPSGRGFTPTAADQQWDRQQWRIDYALLCRSGFTPALHRQADDEGVLLVAGDDPSAL